MTEQTIIKDVLDAPNHSNINDNMFEFVKQSFGYYDYPNAKEIYEEAKEELEDEVLLFAFATMWERSFNEFTFDNEYELIELFKGIKEIFHTGIRFFEMTPARIKVRELKKIYDRKPRKYEGIKEIDYLTQLAVTFDDCCIFYRIFTKEIRFNRKIKGCLKKEYLNFIGEN